MLINKVFHANYTDRIGYAGREFEDPTAFPFLNDWVHFSGGAT